MKYPNITALVPQGEHFDDSAIVNEGGYLSIAHFAAIEKQLTDNAEAIQTAATNLSTANENAATNLNAVNEQLAELNGAKKVADDALIAANATITSQSTEIESLKAENAKLKKLPAKEVSTTTTEVDSPVVGADSKVPAHLDPNNSLNRSADNLFGTVGQKK